MTKICDNKSVGVIIKDTEGRVALLKRARFPAGFAPPAAHIDDHGSPIQAALDETREELGIVLNERDLMQTVIADRQVYNPCRREGGDHHNWWVFAATIGNIALRPDPDETKGAAWYTHAELQALVDRTHAYQNGHIPEAEWTANPGLEPVWLDFLTELTIIH